MSHMVREHDRYSVKRVGRVGRSGWLGGVLVVVESLVCQVEEGGKHKENESNNGKGG